MGQKIPNNRLAKHPSSRATAKSGWISTLTIRSLSEGSDCGWA